MFLITLFACMTDTPIEPQQLSMADTSQHAQVLYEAVDQSLSELTLCGQAQRNFVMPLALRVIASSEDLIDDGVMTDIEDVAQALGIQMKPDVEQVGDSWRIPMSNGSFDVLFLHEGQPVSGDVFDLDSYVQGVTATSSLQLDDLSEVDIEAPIRFEFHWQEEGELAYLLQPLTNPIVVNASLLDLFNIGMGAPHEADLGSFAALANINVLGSVPFSDLRNGIQVDFDATLDAPLFDLATGQPAAATLDGLEAELDDWRIETTGFDFESFPHSLGGWMDFRIVGPTVTYDVRTDFGDGNGETTTTWTCNGDDDDCAPNRE